MRFALPKALIALMALTCACAMGASAAQAYKQTAGPFWTINGAKLGAGESHEVVSASSSGEYSIKGEVLGGPVTIACKKQTVESASIAGGRPSTIKATFKLSECALTGNGSKCKVTEPITTKPLTGTLGYATKGREGKILARFQGSTGKLMEVKFTGTCYFKETEGTGSVIAEIASGGETEEVGKETNAKVDQFRFPTKPITAVWVENAAGGLKEEKAKLSVFGEPAELFGTSELELSGLPEWGIEAKDSSVEGPSWVVEGHKLGASESHEVLSASSSGEYSMTVGYDPAYTIACKKQAVEKASIAGGIPSTLTATFSFSECAVKGNGTGCTVGSPLKTDPLTGELGYETNEGRGKILARFEGSGGHFIDLKLGSSCVVRELESKGSLVAEIVSEGTEAKVNQLRFPTTPIKTMWVENGAGELKEKTASMTGNNETEVIAGTSELELVSLPEWGVEA